ncbi:hypothetical protein [Mycoplasma leonicaptivi]|uniref:hypothetical protein n=1 Tax=Mycoplasma leonicaptivi TaxID=36742 RepID=UPI00047FB043|nr:hypothetical protein [Mycoplasma leonicaptivi]
MKRKHIIFLINGKRRSGKGLLTNAIKQKCNEKFNNNIHVLSFAQPIKSITEPILNELNWDGKDKEVVRPLWIAMGEVGRKIDNNIWCSKVFNKIKDLVIESSKNEQNSMYIIDDLRFPNELDFFKGNLNQIKEKLNTKTDEVSVVSIRIEKFIDAEKFVPGVDDNSTEISFDKLVNICFDHIVPQNTLINNEWIAQFDKVDIIADVVIKNFIKF